jgi:hypothetical protein
MEDWDFRVLFHSIMSQEGGRRLEQHSHVAAQIDPEEGQGPGKVVVAAGRLADAGLILV